MDQSIFEEVCQAGIPFDNHESDLYIPVNETTKEIISRHPEVKPVSTFTNQQNGNQWYDVAFKFLPFWDKKSKNRKINLYAEVLVYLYDKAYYINNSEKKFSPNMVMAIVTDIKEVSGENIYTVSYRRGATSTFHEWEMTRSEIKYILTDGLK